MGSAISMALSNLQSILLLLVIFSFPPPSDALVGGIKSFKFEHDFLNSSLVLWLRLKGWLIEGMSVYNGSLSFCSYCIPYS